MHIILVGNYLPDGQESMQRFANMLAGGFEELGITTETWRPVQLFGAGSKPTNAGVRKWLGYLDKWIVFPVILRWRQRRYAKQAGVRFHICDHSNSPYLGHLDNQRTSITCHDVLAIRGALGHSDSYLTPSRLGEKLQQWILHHLSQAKRLACVSQLTLEQLVKLEHGAHTKHPANWQVIHNAFNADFRPMPLDEREGILRQAKFPLSTPFLLHVGSGQTRKNRLMLLEMVHALGNRWAGTICLAGEAPDEALLARASALGLRDRLVVMLKPNHQTLVALYSHCEAFVFPSYSEGFGWPVIEAQACGVPVIASSIAPMPEVSGGAAIHASPDDVQAFAEAVLTLQQPAVRAALIAQGFENCHRFTLRHMTQAYLRLYE